MRVGTGGFCFYWSFRPSLIIRQELKCMNQKLKTGKSFLGLSYVIDIYKNKIQPERNFIDYSVFVSFFFNTIYHLNREGREKRTQRLIEIFSKNLNLEKDFHYMLSKRLKSEEVIKEDNTVTSKIDNIK